MRFADTSYFIGLLKPRDRLHRQVLAINRHWHGSILTTTWVLMELGNAMNKTPDRQIFLDFVRRSIRADAMVIIPATEDWFIRGFDLYRCRPDKAWSLTDCISFLVMQEHNVTEALTADRHFAQAGFQVLLQN